MASDSAPSGPILDLEGALARVGGDRVLFAELVGFLYEDLPTLRDELRTAVAEGDTNHVRKKAHALKGLVAGCGGVRATKAAQALEDAGDAGDLGRAVKLLDSLNTELERLISALGEFRH